MSFQHDLSGEHGLFFSGIDGVCRHFVIPIPLFVGRVDVPGPFNCLFGMVWRILGIVWVLSRASSPRHDHNFHRSTSSQEGTLGPFASFFEGLLNPSIEVLGLFRPRSANGWSCER